MKAYIHHPVSVASAKQGNGPFHGHELRLTIGLIVKNEEKNLEKCLSSLVPLLKAVPSELIVTDTGSSDRTVEIARKFTDHVISFEWRDDFSAARNTGLDAARGEWFLYLDADEWFDDVTPIIEFFNSGECDGYSTAAYIQKNYRDLLGDSFTDDYVCRVFRHSPGIRFRNKVHEDFVLQPPMKVLDAFVHHYGYVFRTEEERRKKSDRNEHLLQEELKADPDDRKALFQYAGYLFQESPEKAAECAAHGLELERRTNPENRLQTQTRFANQLISAYYNSHRYADMIEAAEDALKQKDVPDVFHLEFSRHCQVASWQLKDYEACAKYGERCRKLYKDYFAGKIDRSAMVYGTFPLISPEEEQKSLAMLGEAYRKLGRANDARECLNDLDLSGKKIDGLFAFCTDLAGETGDWEIAVGFYRRILALEDDGKAEAFFSHLNNYYRNFPSKRREMASSFAAADDHGVWTIFWRLRLAQLNGEKERAGKLLDELCRREGSWSPCCADILWSAMTEKKNLVPFLSHIDAGDFPAMAEKMQAAHEEYSRVVGDYFGQFSFDSAKALLCASCLLERAMLSRSGKEDAELYRSVIFTYFENLAKFIHAVYKPELLAASGFSALPNQHRFGYYAGLALDAKRKGDPAAYLADLRKGLKEYPAMKDCVKFLLKDFEEEQKKRDANAKEFSLLAKQVKRNIEQLIAQGNLKQAGTYTLQLAKLIPEDDDLRRYRRLTGLEQE